MIVQVPEVKKILNDYDICFQTGMMMQITIDLDLGDTIEFNDRVILIHRSAKPSQNDPKILLPAETMTLFMPHVISIQHRFREVVERTPEQKFEWERIWQDLTSTDTLN